MSEPPFITDEDTDDLDAERVDPYDANTYDADDEAEWIARRWGWLA